MISFFKKAFQFRAIKAMNMKWIKVAIFAVLKNIGVFYFHFVIEIHLGVSNQAVSDQKSYEIVNNFGNWISQFRRLQFREMRNRIQNFASREIAKSSAHLAKRNLWLLWFAATKETVFLLVFCNFWLHLLCLLWNY